MASPASQSLAGGTLSRERNREQLAPAWALSLSPDTEATVGGGGSPRLLSGMLVLGCSADASSDKGQELDFLVSCCPQGHWNVRGD